jgi:hypothetical protein
VIAHLGTSSDEFLEELQYIAEELDDMLVSQQPGCDTPPVLLAVDFHQLSDLFAPNDVPIVALPGLLLWVVDAGSAQLWLRTPEPLLAAISRAEAYRINCGKTAVRSASRRLDRLAAGRRRVHHRRGGRPGRLPSF